MDLIYMSDVMAYQSIRSPIYDRYEQNWDQRNSRDKAQVQHHGSRKRGEKETCKICQERQRRSLMSYIRSKSHDHSDQNCITEQTEEEEEEEEREEQQQAQAEAQNTNKPAQEVQESSTSQITNTKETSH